MNKQQLIIACFSFWLALAGTSEAQLANTIWRGDAKLTIPALTLYDNNADPLPYPKTTTGISIIVPVEVWFWDSSKFLVVFRQGEFGFNPEEPHEMIDLQAPNNMENEMLGKKGALTLTKTKH
jgi:hypothetical protein